MPFADPGLWACIYPPPLRLFLLVIVLLFRPSARLLLPGLVFTAVAAPSSKNRCCLSECACALWAMSPCGKRMFFVGGVLGFRSASDVRGAGATKIWGRLQRGQPAHCDRGRRKTGESRS
ncbi:hypothetical protein B0H67DRAFT_56656 [Lasiosphaeris hirsuta]|uniref:Uncharacterized protein n=1 Tax=Lasiosphaeris hirsuta TaxID=260670 RepID=A0AA40BBK9_9PEZI|nr:hypothetical protein B0H67DRAFT_56656 [Lasiosphaeris hirsuta]